MNGYLNSENKSECYGCEACVQACPKNALVMEEDEEGFSYPKLNKDLCVECGLCHKVCPYENVPDGCSENKTAFGGYNKDQLIRDKSTSGGAFSAIVEAWCDSNYVIFGAASKGLEVYHTYITDKNELSKFRKSKYSQSIIGNSFKEVKIFLNDGKKVLFSGTPCHIAGLKSYLGKLNAENLLTVEVICEGVPSPIFMRKYNQYLKERYKSEIFDLDYRYTDSKPLDNPKRGKWDFQVMNTILKSGKQIKIDRWFNPFWSIWLNHLMSRPSCYQCHFASISRLADISLGDLWGVHLYCPELYGRNGGASLIVSNTNKGNQALQSAKKLMYGHELNFETALKYQSPMRKTISMNSDRESFIKDLNTLDYISLCKKWSNRPSLNLLWSKYIWGNRQKVFVWNLKHSYKNKKRKGQL